LEEVNDMALTTGTITQGDVCIHSATIRCDACGHEAPRQEATTRLKAERLAVRKAEEEGFVAHDRGRT
jgi:hypothetical protein